MGGGNPGANERSKARPVLSELAAVEQSRARADLAFALTVLFSLLLVGLLYASFREITLILLVSALLSYVLVPLVDVVARAMPRVIAVLVVALGGAGLVAGLGVLLGPPLAGELTTLPQVAADLAGELERVWERVYRALPPVVVDLVDRGVAGLQRASPDTDTVTGWATRAAGAVTTTVSVMLFAPIFVFFMLRSYHRFVGWLSHLVPPRWRERFFQRMHEADEALSGFVRGQLLVAGVVGLLYGVALALLGVPLGLFVGLIAAIGELVPFLGGAVALTLGVLLALGAGDFRLVLWVGVVFLVVQTLESAVLTPWIIGGRARIRPVAVIVALAIGSQLFGFIGLLLAVPAAAVVKVAGRAALDAYVHSRFFRRRVPV